MRTNFYPLVLLTLLLMQSIVFGQAMSDINQRLEAYQKSVSKAQVDFFIDKSVYSPGEQVWIVGRSEYINNPSVFPEESKVILYNANYQKLLQLVFPNKNGSFHGNIQLPKIIQDGTYWVTVMAGDQTAIQEKIVVRKNPLPKYILNATFESKRYSAREQLNIKVNTSDYYSERIRGIDVEMNFYNGHSFEKVAEATTDANGEAVFNLNLPDKINQDVLLFQVMASQKGYLETLTGVINLKQKDIDMLVVPEGGVLLEGKEGNLFFMALDHLGNAFEMKGSLLDDQGNKIASVTTNKAGLGQLSFTPNQNRQYTIAIEKPYELSMPLDPGIIKDKGARLSTQIEGNEVIVSMFSNQPMKDPAIIGMMNGMIAFEAKIGTNQTSKIKLPLSQFPQGVIALALIDQGRLLSTCKVVNLKNPGDMGQITLNKEVFQQREKVNLNLKLNPLSENETGSTSIVVVNDSWLDREFTSMPIDFKHVVASNIEGLNYITLTTLGKYKDDAEVMNQLVNVFEISGADWQKAISQVVYPMPKISAVDQFANKIMDEMRGVKVAKDGKNVIYTNNIYDEKLLVSNPEMTKEWFKVKHETTPAYKKLLAQGVPVEDVIRALKYYDVVDGTKIVFLGSHNSISNQDGALIVLDGQKLGTDKSVLESINPTDISDIRVSTDPIDMQKYSALNSVGLIEIKTKKGLKPEDETTDEKFINPEDLEQFDSPDYADPKEAKKRKNDFRTTLYWNGNVQLDEQGNATIEYYNADIRTKVQGVVHIMSSKGYTTIPFSYVVE